MLAKEAAAVDWLRDAFGHLKVIGHVAAAVPVFPKAAVEPDAEGRDRARRIERRRRLRQGRRAASHLGARADAAQSGMRRTVAAVAGDHLAVGTQRGAKLELAITSGVPAGACGSNRHATSTPHQRKCEEKRCRRSPAWQRYGSGLRPAALNAARFVEHAKVPIGGKF